MIPPLTQAEALALVLLARDPEGLTPIHDQLAWAELLEALRGRGLVRKDRLPGTSVEVYRLTAPGIGELWAQAQDARTAAESELGLAYAAERATPGEQRAHITNFEAWTEQAKILTDAYAAVEWGEFGPRKKERSDDER